MGNYDREKENTCPIGVVLMPNGTYDVASVTVPGYKTDPENPGLFPRIAKGLSAPKAYAIRNKMLEDMGLTFRWPPIDPEHQTYNEQQYEARKRAERARNWHWDN